MVKVPLWTMRLRRSEVIVGILLLLSISTAPTQVEAESECGESEVKCLCGVPRCVDLKLVNNGVRDCQDASDEQGQWDLVGCVEGKERTKRGAVSELLRVTNGGATTTFFEGERGRTRPVGVLTTTMGSFQVSGTTTEYITKLIATYIKGTYARILTTTSRIYAALPTASLPEIRPTGFITSTLSTEVNGYATTVHTTDFYRTYIDNTYAQQVSKYSNVVYPPWYTDPIEPSSSTATESEETNKIYPTPVYIPIDDLMTLDSTPPVIQHNGNGRFGKILVNEFPTSEEGLKSAEEYPRSSEDVPRGSGDFEKGSGELLKSSEEFPRQVEGMFERPGGDVIPLELQAPLSFKLNDNEVRVTGTHGEFVAGERKYNVFTGSYLQGEQTFLFFFGNTALNPSSPAQEQQQTILVENGRQRDHLVVDMSQNLKLIVPGTKERTTIDTTLEGQPVEGVMVEIEGSETRDHLDLITVEGATPTESPTPHDPRIATVKVTMDRDIRKVSASKSKVNIRVVTENNRNVVESSPRPVSGNPRPVFEKPRPLLDQSTIQPEENEVPRGRAVKPFSAPKAESQVQSTNEDRPVFNLPRYTVGPHDGSEAPRSYYEATTNSDEELTVESSTARVKEQVKQRQPVFQRGDKTTPRSQIQTAFSRKPKSFSDLKHLGATGGNNAWETNDLMSAASNRHATVTYVGFADFTTTVGNTVIVFMPRTRMLEDLSVHASSTRSVSVDPTRYTYLTTTEEDLPPVTTPRRQEPITVPEIIAVPEIITVPEIIPVPEIVEITTPKPPPVIPRPKFTKKRPEPTSTSGFSPPETTVLFSGRQTLFSTLLTTSTPSTKITEFPRSTPLFTPVVQVEKSKTFEPEMTSTHRLETAVFQKDKINPTGLVSSIGGSIVKDSTTTLITSLILGTFIDGSYAQVIKSTSTVFFQPSQTLEPTPIFIAPTPVPTLSSTFPSTTQSPVFSYAYEVTTSNPEEETTTFERAEVRVTSTTTEVVTTVKEAETEEPPTTTVATGSGNSKEEETTTTSLPINIQKEDLDEALNEIERARKVAGRPQDQIIVEDKKVDSTLEKPTTEKVVEEPTTTTTTTASPPPEEVTEQKEEETTPNPDQTIYVTKTVPTTVFRTYTYFTTYFIPKEDSTVSSIISREVTSTAVGFVKKTFSSIVPTATVQVPTPEATTEPQLPNASYEDDEDEEGYTPTYYKTYFTTFTYLTTFFTGETSSISSREEVISSVSTITQLQPSSAAISQLKPTASPLEAQPLISNDITEDKQKESNVPPPKLPSVIEQTVLKTFFTTYTYFSTLFNGAEASTRSRIEIITNIVPTVVKSTVSHLPQTSIKASSVVAQSHPSSILSHSLEDLSEGGSSVSETSEPTSHQDPVDYYELESSEMTTDRSVYNEQELQEVDAGPHQTPALKTLFTTFSFFTTYYKGGSSSVATRLQTVTNVVSDGTEADEATDADQFPVFPITYLTTFTYWTTHFKGESTVVTSREETISNVVTPGVDDITPSSTTQLESIQVQPTEEPVQREPKKLELEAVIQTDEPELELTTYFTTYTYFTSSYIGDETIVNSRLETVTNIISGTPSETLMPSSAEHQGRAVGSAVPDQELIEEETLPVGLLSTVTNREIVDSTTTEYLTDVYGTYIDGIYAQVLESTSRVIKPTNIAMTKFLTDATDTPIGLLGVNQGKTIEGEGTATTFYQTATLGMLVDGKYAQIISSSSSISRDANAATTEDLQKTGLVRVIDGSLVEGDKTTFYTSSIYGTVIDNQYGQIIESTTRYVITPTEPLILPPIQPTLTSSEVPSVPENVETTTSTTTTTEGSVEVNPLRRLPGRARDRGRVSVAAPSSKSFTPFITPFASRSRPTFTPKKKEATSAVIVSREEVTPTVTATLAPTSTRSPLQNRPRFRRPNQEEKEIVSTFAPVTATPKLPTPSGRSRFQKPSAVTNAPPVSSANPTQPRLTSARSSPISPARVSSSSGRGLSSRFSLRPRGSLAPARPSIATATATQALTTLPPPLEEEQEHVEVAPVTTESPKTTTAANRFGNNRFRLNPRLNVQHLLSSTTTEKPTTPSRPRKTFTRPTLPTIKAAQSTTEAPEEEEPTSHEDQANNQSEQPIITTTVGAPTTTGKPSLKNLLASRKLVSGNSRAVPPSPNPRPQQNNRQLTTTPSPTPRTTTRRSFAPRARPQGFPSRGLVRGPPTTDKSEETELNYDESKNVGERLEIPADAALLSDVLGVDEPDLVDSGSEFFETVRSSPYESYEAFSDEIGPFRRRHARQVEFGSRSRAQILRTNFRRAVKSNFPISSSDNDKRDADAYAYDDDYYYDETPPSPPPPPPTTSKPKPTTNSRASSRFRGKLPSSISPSPSFASSRQTPFTLLPPQTTPRSFTRPPSNAALLNSRRITSRYRPEFSTTNPPPRTTSRFKSSRNQNLKTTTQKPKSRFSSPIRNTYRGNYEEPTVYEKPTERTRSILTVTHFVPSETTVSVINGKSTEFKTLLVPSPSVEVLSPYQYTNSVENGQEVLVLNSQVTSTPSIGFGGEVTRFIIKEVPTTTVTFTPTTIRGRKTSFSHVLSTHYYTIDPSVSTISVNTFTNMPGDNNQLTNLLLSQLLGSLNLAGLQQQNQQMINGDPGTTQTVYNTKTTTYVTTITDFTSTIVPITLHGKAIKTTIVESQVNVLTATEFITESTIIPPVTQTQQQIVPQVSAFNPALLQGLLLQQQLNQQQQTQQQIESTKVEHVENSIPTLVTLFVSGRNPGEFSTVVSTVMTVSEGRKRRDIIPSKVDLRVVPTETVESVRRQVELDDSYSYSEGNWIQTQVQDGGSPIRTESLRI